MLVLRDKLLTAIVRFLTNSTGKTIFKTFKMKKSWYDINVAYDANTFTRKITDVVVLLHLRAVAEDVSKHFKN